MKKKFKKPPKNTILGPFWARSPKIWAKMNFPGEKGPIFEYSNYLLLCKKSEKTNDSFIRKMPNRKRTVILQDLP